MDKDSLKSVGLQVIADSESLGLCVTRFCNYTRKRNTEVIVLDPDTALDLASELYNALDTIVKPSP